jgi:hypothetical protein
MIWIDSLSLLDFFSRRKKIWKETNNTVQHDDEPHFKKG